MSSRYSPDRPWAMQPCDTPAGYAWFTDFLLLPPPRDWRILLRRSGCPYDHGQLAQEVRDGLWEERATAWDRHLGHERLKTVEKEVRRDAKALAQEQLAAAMDVRLLGHEEVKRLRSQLQKIPDHAGGIRPETAIRAVTQGITMERLVLGQATEILGVDAKVEENLLEEALSLDELRAYREIQAKLEEARARKGAA
jgi:hypothetical protein